MLNRARGEAVQGLGLKSRNMYKSNISNIISSEGVDIIEDEVINVLTISLTAIIKLLELRQSQWKNYLCLCNIKNRYFSVRKKINWKGNL